MTDEPNKPGGGKRNGSDPPDRPGLRIVKAEEELSRRATWIHALATRDQPNADPFPPIGHPDEVAGTWLAELNWTKRSKKDEDPVYMPGCNLTNAITVFVHDPRWRGVLAYDEFAESIVTTRMPPWHMTDSGGAAVGDWTEEDTTRAESWLHRAYGLKLSDSKILQAVAVAARGKLVHPVRAYLRGLEWDGIKRLTRWLHTLLGADETPYTAAVGKAWLISAVARVMKPGCKVDTMLVLEGKTGIRKSLALRVLTGDAWFTSIAGAIDPTETPQLLRRKWIAELDELASLRRTREQETIKSFLSRQEDNYRAPYARRARDFPRQCVFAGSTNEDHYLRDPTGARRFWPVRCRKIWVRGIEIERDQLWAEAVACYDAGERWYFSDDEITKLVVAEQSERYEEDAWTDAILEHCSVLQTMGVTMDDVLTRCLGIEMAKWTHADVMRVGAILRRIGWRPKGRERPRRYWPDATGAE